MVSKKKNTKLNDVVNKVDRKRSLAAKKGAVTRAKNREIAIKQQFKLHHKIFFTASIAIVLLFTFVGIKSQFEASASNGATGTVIGLAGKCLDNRGNNVVNKNPVQLYRCNGTNAQKWTVTSEGFLKNNTSNFCLDVAGGSLAENTYLQLYQCNGTAAQKFNPGNGSIINTRSDLCAAVKNANITDSTRLVTKVCNANAAQIWNHSGYPAVIVSVPGPDPAPAQPDPTPTPNPNPTPTPPSGYGRDSNGTCGGKFVLRTTKPEACNTGTGVIAPKPTKVYTGSLRITQDNTVIENVIINGQLSIRAKNVTVRNCEIRSTTTSGTIVVSTTAATNAVIEFNEIYSTIPSRVTDGIGNRNYSAYRNNIHDVVDGFAAHSSGMTDRAGDIKVKLEGNYIHDLIYYSPDPGHASNGTHHDGIQIQGGSNITITGNFFAGTSSSKNSYVGRGGVPNPKPGLAMSNIMTTPNTGPISSLFVEDNWLYGGYMSVNANATLNNTRFLRNKFDRTMPRYGGSQNYGALNIKSPNPGVNNGSGTPNKNIFIDNGAEVVVLKA